MKKTESVLGKERILRIYSKQLGDVKYISNFLYDLHKVYSNIIIYQKTNLIASKGKNEFDAYIHDREEYYQKIKALFNENIGNLTNETIAGRNLSFWIELIGEAPTGKNKPDLNNELLNEKFQESLLLDEDNLKLTKVNFSSPGYWELVGNEIVISLLIHGIEALIIYLIKRKKNVKNIKNNKKEQTSKRNKKKEIDEFMKLLSQNIPLIEETRELMISCGMSEEQVNYFITKRLILPFMEMGDYIHDGIIDKIE